MAIYDSYDFELARKAIEDMLERSKKAQAKFKPGTSQYSLQVNRIHALNLSLALLSNEPSETIHNYYSSQELRTAIAPLKSLIHKSEKAQTNLKLNSWQYSMLSSNLKALYLALDALKDVIDKNQSLDQTI